LAGFAVQSMVKRRVGPTRLKAGMTNFQLSMTEFPLSRKWIIIKKCLKGGVFWLKFSLFWLKIWLGA